MTNNLVVSDNSLFDSNFGYDKNLSIVNSLKKILARSSH